MFMAVSYLIYCYPADIWCENDVVLMSMRRDHVASTLIQRHFGTKCPLGLCFHLERSGPFSSKSRHYKLKFLTETSNFPKEIITLKSLNSLFKVKYVLLYNWGDGYLQSTLVISTSVISNNRLSRRENLILVLT